MNREELIEAARGAYVAAWEAEDRAGRIADHNRTRAGIVAALAVFEQAHTAHAKPVDTSPEPVKTGADFSHVTPTDDEREARDKAMDEAWGFRADTRSLSEKWSAQHWFNAGWDACARRTVQGEPNATCPKCGTTVTDQTPSTFYAHHDEACGGALEEPQGEPTDAMVKVVAQHMANAAADWLDIGVGGHGHGVECANWSAYADDARAALRAAADTQTGENRG